MTNVAENLNVPPPNHVLVLDGQGWIGLVDQMGTETSIVNAARVSFGKIRQVMDQRDAALVKYLIANHHTSPLEHMVFTFLVHCPLFVRSQWHRHRTWSYNEISRRYTQEEMTFYVPPEIRQQAANNRQASIAAELIKQDECRALIAEHHAASLRLFERLLAEGVCREQARGVLPQNMMTTFWATVDLNNLIKFIELRDSPHAQAEIREYGQAIKKLIAPIVPHVAEVLNWS